MNRRSFMRKVGGTLAGVVALALPNELKPKFIPCHLYKFDPKMANIDPNLEDSFVYFRQRQYLRERYIYWGNDQDNWASYFHKRGEGYVMVLRNYYSKEMGKWLCPANGFLPVSDEFVSAMIEHQAKMERT